ncbi:MAG: hypothetical protein J1F23_08505 [Oscillospiraceae bacterium]|nr:hypothetical protein [Oscillospiraceae bacterium]
MDRGKNIKKSQHSVHNVLFWAVGSLLILTMLSTWIVSGTYAKYVISSYMLDSAKVAKTGIGSMELLEHEAELNNGIYTLTKNEVTKNTYDRVIPGVDIAKDPFIRLDIASDVTFELYIKVVKSNPFPDTVTYELTDDWIEIDATNGIYKYKDAFEAGTPFKGEIGILENDELIVSEHYVCDIKTFTLTFSAWLVQVGVD